MKEDARIWFLFKKIQHQALQGTIETLKAQISLSDPGTAFYTTCAIISSRQFLSFLIIAKEGM